LIDALISVQFNFLTIEPSGRIGECAILFWPRAQNQTNRAVRNDLCPMACAASLVNAEINGIATQGPGAAVATATAAGRTGEVDGPVLRYLADDCTTGLGWVEPGCGDVVLVGDAMWVYHSVTFGFEVSLAYWFAASFTAPVDGSVLWLAQSPSFLRLWK
jgi:hypothetical protein